MRLKFLQIFGIFVTTFSLGISHEPSSTPPFSKVLFIQPSMVIGGVERAFADMINQLPLPCSQFDVCLLQRGGALEQELRSGLHFVSFDQARKHAYKAVVSFHHATRLSTWVGKIKANRRIQLIHTDLSSWGKSWLFSPKKLRKKIDVFIGVSKLASASFKKFYPKDSKKVLTIHNVINAERIVKLAQEPIADFPSKGVPVVVSVCRISPPKALDRAIRVHKRLENDGIHFQWVVIGGGDTLLQNTLEKQVSDSGLTGKFIFLGARTNPYPYIKRADIFAFPSIFEGWGIVTTEAQILQRPILVTDVGGAKEQITSGINGLIVANNEKAIYQGLKRLLENEQLRNTFCTSLKSFRYDNDAIFKSLVDLCFPSKTPKHSKHSMRAR